jgi:hypothetical protein
VITRDDFEQFSNPVQLLKIKKYPIYKIHGSTKNLITGKITRKSLIATIKAFGLNKEGLNVFQLEPYKASVFENFSKGRSVVVMGYSGSDDFAIIPTLKTLKNIKNLIWVRHIGNKENIKIDKSDKIIQLLIEIAQKKNAENVYLVHSNTTQMIKSVLETQPDLATENFNITPLDWFKTNIREPEEFEKYLLSWRIYTEFELIDHLSRCADQC